MIAVELVLKLTDALPKVILNVVSAREETRLAELKYGVDVLRPAEHRAVQLDVFHWKTQNIMCTIWKHDKRVKFARDCESIVMINVTPCTTQKTQVSLIRTDTFLLIQVIICFGNISHWRTGKKSLYYLLGMMAKSRRNISRCAASRISSFSLCTWTSTHWKRKLIVLD